MRVVSACELPVGSRLWQAHDASWILTVVCRATFLLRPTESVLAPTQEAIVEEDDHWNGDPGRSLRVASDLAPLKLRADVTLIGRAYGPRGNSVQSVTARMLVGDVDKSVEVYGDRYFDQEGKLHEGPRFTSMPLLHERAAGGPGTANPVGVRGVADTYGRVALPNLQPPGLHVASPSDHIEPTGFGPIAGRWPTRVDKLGRGRTLPPDGPFPEDMDAAYFNHAPRDQQVALIRDNERIVLEHLHPEHPRLSTNLPGVRPRATVERASSAHEVVLRCDTLWIDTDRGLCTLTWRGQVPLEGRNEEGRIVVTLDGPGAARRPAPLETHDATEVTETLVPGTRLQLPSSPVLPFVASPGGRDAGRTAGGLPFVGGAPARSEPPPPTKPIVPPTFGSPSPPLPAVVPPSPASPVVAPPPLVPPPVVVPPAVVASPAVAPPVWTPPVPPAPVPPRPVLTSPIRPPMGSTPWAVPDAPQPAMTVGQMASAEPGIAPAPAPAPAASPSPAVEAVPAEAPKAAAKIEARRAVQLVWFDPTILPRVRRNAGYKPILEALDDRPLDPDLDDPAIALDHVSMENRRDAFEVLARGEAVDEPKLHEAVDRALREDGKFVPPLLLVAGELRFAFDELAMLKATLSIATPFAPTDEALKSAIADAREFLRLMDYQCPPAVIEGFTTRVHEAFRKARRTTVPAYLEEQAERALIDRRSYQTRDVFGATHLRLSITPAGAAKPTPLYLPDTVAKRLPLFARFTARVLCEACLQEDQFEQHPIALRGWALARVQPMPFTIPAPPAKPAKG